MERCIRFNEAVFRLYEKSDGAFWEKDGEMLPDLYAKKKYILLTNCYTKTLENCITGVTDSTFIVMDRVCTTAGMELVGEAVTTNTFAMKELPDWKHAECVNLGKKSK